MSQKRVLPEPDEPITQAFKFRALAGIFGRVFMVRNSVPVRMTLFWNFGSTNGLISSGVPHEAFCQVLFCVIDANSCESAKVQSAKDLRFALSACGLGRLLLLDEVVPLTADTPCTQNTAHVALGVLHRPLGYSGFGCGLYNVLAGKLFPVCE